MTPAPTELLTPREVGNWLDMSTDSLSQLRYRGKGPRYLKLTARKIVYKRSDVEAWLESTARTQTGAAA